MKSIAVIPARMASTRFPGKPLADILGLPMIEHVRRRVALCDRIDTVVVATCDKEIAEVVEGYGGQVAMTADSHERCTDRVAEATASLEGDVVVNVQGDVPMVRPEMMESLLRELEANPEIPCTNLMVAIENEEDFRSRHVVKTVADSDGNALYFSREPIPSAPAFGDSAAPKFEQLGVVAFRRDFLFKFGQLPPTPLEIAESVDMLRAIEHGYQIRMVPTPFKALGVDTPADLEQARLLLESDDLVEGYLKGQVSG